MSRTLKHILQRVLGVMGFTLLAGGAAFAQLPSSVDIDLAPGASANQLDVRLRANGQNFNEVISNLVFTIRWADTSPATLGVGSSTWCPATTSAFPIGPSAQVTTGGFKYRTYSSVGTVPLSEIQDNSGCGDAGAMLTNNAWVTVLTINVGNNGTGCTAFQIVNDTYTIDNNRSFFISLNGQQVPPLTGTIEATGVNAGNCTVDCNGVVGGPAIPGSACNDNNACTINDVYTGTAPNCGCAGTPDNTDSDSDGVPNCSDNCPNVAGQIGSSCNDGNPCTTGDVLNASCNCVGVASGDTDGDGVCNAQDNCPNVAGQIGSACNDGNPCTTGDVLNASCNCVGVASGDTDGDGVCNAQDNCPNVAGQIGSACNDGNPCTTGDVLNASCNCVGVASGDTDGDGVCNAQDNCPNVAGQIGSACNDNNACTINDVLNASCNCVGTPDNTDSDSDGVPNCSDNCPNVAGQIGSACNDNNACTINDVLNASCNCVGTPDNTDSDSDGVPNCSDNCPNVAGQIGSACNDNNACTINDVLNASCNCVGTPDNTDSDSDGVPNCSDNCPNVAGQIGSACNDNNACTINDVLNASCNCVGTPDNTDSDSDGVPNCSDNCPNVAGQIGSACNDGNPCTTGDVLNASCNCVGVASGDADGDGVCNAQDNCPNVAGQIGSACNDGDACTINDVLNASCNCVGTFQDTDSDGVCDANDACPLLPNLVPGNPCDDGNGSTVGDVVTANCVCAGVLPNDCEGTPGGPAQPGTACNDNNPLTGNDTWSVNCVCAGQVIDCEGTAGGTALPGTACNDNNPLTGNDTWSANCVCAGQVIDCEGTAGGTALPGTACNDNNPLTGNDTWSANCVCAGQVIDCEGTPGGTALPGTACNDNNPNTSGDTWSANCVCAGVLPNDCEGTPGGPAQPGTACNDNNPLTGNDTWSVNCVCAGQVIDCEGTAGGTALPGTACNDNNPLTGNDTWSANCVCAGQVIDCEGTAGGTALPGTACNDNNPNTSGDTWSANCVCAGVLPNDCEGTPGGPAQPGTACNDNNPLTGNDTWSANCVCAGQVIDCEGTAGGTALPGTACNDNNACTINDVYQSNCGCAGTFQDTDNDGVCNAQDNCPNVSGQIGSSCDDGNNTTTGDALNSNCVCIGTPVSGCDHPVTLVLETDANGVETTWEILPLGGGSPVCGGGNYDAQSNSFVSESCCLNTGCYVLRVLDAGGDGITTGGYVLNTQSGRRIIDNRDNGAFTSVSQVANGEGFCLPMGSDRLITVSCDKEYWLANEYIVADGNPAVSAQWQVGTQTDDGYEMWFFNPNGGYSFRRFHSHAVSDGYANVGATRACHIKLNNWAVANHLPEGQLLNVRVRGRVNGINNEWGGACRFRMDAALALCPPTQLVNNGSMVEFSCGVSRQFPSSQKLWAWSRPGGNKYQFEFTLPAENYIKVRNSTVHYITMNWSPDPLLNGRTYNVRVRLSKNGGATWCPWGETCMVTINNGGSGIVEGATQRELEGASAPSTHMWPNPNRGEQLYLTLDGISNEASTVSMEVYDMFGSRVATWTLPAQDGTVSTVVDLPTTLANGMYMVHLASEGAAWTQRLLIQR